MPNRWGMLTCKEAHRVLVSAMDRDLRTGERLPEPDLAAQKSIMLRHYAAMQAHFGIEPGMRLARKHLSWYSRGLPGSAEFRASVMRIPEVPAVLAQIDRVLDEWGG